ncbi:class I SAM-dependent methyltransferase [Arsenicicoccus dermatophilus]|uniref:class I SAM-dependent methyltransferase n=1 Tax=Arsenicicoccus dermatophilus TaxID=1076331 RepID=UPI001F4C9A60|nr:class I SAM-dependent methyltransferase [Arsenicicoccus dermatophilus]MCH8614044.1 class I SAM-dependent methyltransferase [Arsenicicoccus dermatophilus]
MSETTTAMPGAATEPVEVIDAESAAGLAEATAAMGRRPVDLAVLAMVAASHQSCGESVRVSPGAADEDATVLARLLALDASGEDTRTLVDDEERACWALERTAGGAVVVRRPPGAAPLVGIRATVPPLATELVCQLVAAGDEGWGKPFPRPGEVRRRARLEQEASAAETLVHDWLGLDDVPGEGTTRESWWHRMGGSDDLTLLRDTWFDWLVARGSMREVGGLLTSRPDRPAPVAVTDPTVRDLGRRLAAHRDLVLRVLTGRAPSADLLDVPSLRPSRLMAEEPALAALWEELAVLVLARARELPDRRLVVVDVGGVGADNDILRRAMDVAGADHVEVPAGRPPHPQVEADVVLAIGALHRWADPAEAARAVREMLAPQGLLVAVEQTEMSGLGLLVAGLLDGGFVDPRGDPAAPRCTPATPGSRPCAMPGSAGVGFASGLHRPW